MRKPAFLILAVALSAPALAWVPKLEETTARNVIDGAYGRRDPVPTFQTVDLNVKDGQFVAGEKAVQVFDGGEKCVADWLAAPADFGKGSRPASVTASGQADQLYPADRDPIPRDGWRYNPAASAWERFTPLNVELALRTLEAEAVHCVAWTDGAPSCHRASPLRSTRRTAAPAGRTLRLPAGSACHASAPRSTFRWR